MDVGVDREGGMSCSKAMRGGDPAGSVDRLEQQQQLELCAGDSEHTDE